MKLYTFRYFYPGDGWRTYFAPTKEEVIRAQSEYVKSADRPDWVGVWKVHTIKPSAETICALINSAIEGDLL